MRDYDALIAYLDGRARTPFAWGSSAHDCASFAIGAVAALNGRDLLAELGCSWSTKAGAARVLRKLGGLAGAADRVLERLDGTAFAHRGDLGLVVLEGRESLVVFEGELVVGAGINGLARLPRQLAVAAWRVDPPASDEAGA